MTRNLLHLATCTLGAIAMACSAADACPDEQPTRSVETGTTDQLALVYESAPWSGPLEPFPAMGSLSFKHDLGMTPKIVATYLSFSESGTGSSSVAESAGNAALIDCVDSQVIRVRNDTCEKHFFIRVVAMATPGAPTDVTCSED
ncbi:MAG TPA: hypothetical protein VFQ35_29000 [Polyangiaceae bacterium]|nr:hypothetical protein [Polyangiaceae bacterium]